MPEFIEYEYSIQRYTESNEIDIPRNCNGFVVTNVGTTLATIDNFPINPALVPGANGESFGVGGNLGEVLRKKQFTLGLTAGVGAAVMVVFKNYPKSC